MSSTTTPLLSLMVTDMEAIPPATIVCMWHVLTKCKDSLENGRRLENLSWRMWYRQCAGKRQPERLPSLGDTIQESHPLPETISPPRFPKQTPPPAPTPTPACVLSSTARSRPSSSHTPSLLGPHHGCQRRKFFIASSDDSSSNEEEDDDEDDTSSVYDYGSFSYNECHHHQHHHHHHPHSTAHSSSESSSNISSENNHQHHHNIIVAHTNNVYAEALPIQKIDPKQRLDHPPISALSMLLKREASSQKQPSLVHCHSKYPDVYTDDWDRYPAIHPTTAFPSNNARRHLPMNTMNTSHGYVWR